MFALTELHRVTGDDRLRDYYSAWLDYHIQEGYDIVWSDSCPRAITAVSLLRESSSDAYQRVVDDVLQYLRVDAPRTDYGGISHTGFIGNARSIWVDSVFMFGMVLTRWGELSEDASALDLLSEQMAIFAPRLQHEDGLMQHADGWPGDVDNDIYWNRGNSWVTASLSDYLRVRLLRGGVGRPRREGVSRPGPRRLGASGLGDWPVVDDYESARRDLSGDQRPCALRLRNCARLSLRDSWRAGARGGAASGCRRQEADSAR